MIDTHLHILPGVDDGPETLQESLALARALVQEGVHTAVATPHYNDEFPQYSASEIAARVYALQQELDHKGISLRLLVGHEALIKPGLIEDIKYGRIATLNGSRYLLLELWSDEWISQTERVIFELRVFGIVPVIAHPERYRAIQQDPQRLVPLLQQGALTQLSAISLAGLWGKTVRRCAETLLKRGLISCIASDAHDLHKRPPSIKGTMHYMEQLLGRVHLYQMIETCPDAIIHNEDCYVAKWSADKSYGKVERFRRVEQ